MKKLAALLLLGTTPALAQTFLGPIPYVCTSNSPWHSSTSLYLETFEDNALNTPGVTGNGSVVAPSGATDSVDCDDGVIDGLGRGGHSYFGDGASGITFIFNAAALGGRLPQRAGIVWTDGVHNSTPNSVHFQAYNASNQLIGEIAGTHPDNSSSGETGEDRFYGVEYGPGILKIRIYQTAGCCGIEVDHLQYGFAGCPADLNGDQQVDDVDFVLFAQGYDVFDCTLQPPCAADLNGDGVVDDIDFVLFAQGYDLFVCP